MKLFNELQKNFKIIFRNWVTLMLIIVAPILLILLVGYSLSGNGLHDIQIGVTTNTDITSLLLNQSNRIKLYNDTNSCISDMISQKSNLCLEINSTNIDDDKNNLTSSNIIFYYDNTREKISIVLITELKEFFGLTAERISLISVNDVIDNMQNLLNFLYERIDDLEQFKSEAISIREDLINRQQNLIKLQASFAPKYSLIKSIHTTINNNSNTLNEDSSILIKALINLREQNSDLANSILFESLSNKNLSSTLNKTSYIISYVANINNLSNLNMSIFTNKSFNYNNYSLSDLNYSLNNSYNINITKNLTINKTNLNLANFDYYIVANTYIDSSQKYLFLSLMDANQKINDVLNVTNSTITSLNKVNQNFNDLVIELDLINQTLSDEINRSNNYVLLINQSVERIDILTIDAIEQMSDLSKIDPSYASKIIKPIKQEFKTLIDINNLQIAFPFLLSTILLFISIIFSNILTKQELESKAYLRNIIAPVNDLLYVSGMILTNFIIVGFQLIVLLIVAQTQFNINIVSNFSNFLPVIITLLFTFIFVGMAIAYLSNNVESSILISTFTALGIFLTSEAVNSIEAMPKLASIFASFNPLVVSNKVLRQILFFDVSLKNLVSDYLLLVLYFMISLVILILIAKYKNKSRF